MPAAFWLHQYAAIEYKPPDRCFRRDACKNSQFVLDFSER